MEKRKCTSFTANGFLARVNGRNVLWSFRLRNNMSKIPRNSISLPRSAIVKEYGEDLADDLIARHKAAEAKLPANQKNQFIKPSLISKYIAFYCSIIFVFATTCKVNMQHPKSQSSSLKSTGAAAARNPDFPAREDLFRYKCFTGVTQKNKERVKSEATLEQHAAVEEESYYNTLPFVYS